MRRGDGHDREKWNTWRFDVHEAGEGVSMTAPLLIYALIGPLAWLLYGLSLSMAWARMNRLRRPALPLAETPPVAILIPAKDEQERISLCLDSVLAQDYSNFTVIAIDDRSTDQTGRIMDEYQRSSGGKIRAIHIPTDGLPEGWLGKCNALYTAAAQATGQWLLFVDSDVKIEPDALRTVLALAVGRGYDAVSILTHLECESFLERLVLPLAAASVSTMCLVSLTNDDNRKVAFANGQFLLIRRSAYEAVGGHAAVRSHITEDVALMRLLKAAAFRTRLYLGRKFASTRMHSTLRQMLHGWGRIYSGASDRRPWRILGAIAFVAISGLSVYPAAAYGAYRAMQADYAWLATAGAHWILMTGILMVMYQWSGNRKRYALAFPLGAAALLALYSFALRLCRTGQIAWRGTKYNYAAASSKT
jgi:cellulose synthase/poly-beta-1,6-N-acetylglucosamine synthase-like glycosyltransferase